MRTALVPLDPSPVRLCRAPFYGGAHRLKHCPKQCPSWSTRQHGAAVVPRALFEGLASTVNRLMGVRQTVATTKAAWLLTYLVQPTDWPKVKDAPCRLGASMCGCETRAEASQSLRQ